MKNKKPLTPRQIGDLFEEAAADFYRGKGYTVLSHSYRYQKYEIDLIVKKGNTVVFVEVKARAEKNGENPLDKIDIEKMRNIYLCSKDFKTRLRRKHIDTDRLHFRYDGIGILFDEERNIRQILLAEDYYHPSRHIYQ